MCSVVGYWVSIYVAEGYGVDFKELYPTVLIKKARRSLFGLGCVSVVFACMRMADWILWELKTGTRLTGVRQKAPKGKMSRNISPK